MKTYMTNCLEHCYEYDTETGTLSSHRVCTFAQGAQAESLTILIQKSVQFTVKISL